MRFTARTLVFFCIAAGVGFARFCPAQTVTSSKASSVTSQTAGIKTLARLESDNIDPERKVLTLDRLTSSGTRIIWTYSPEEERKY